MLIHHLFEAPALTIDSPEFRNWFSGSKVVDASGNPLPVYHGAGRPDRIGARFRKSRATAGPMAYFTDDPEIASNYAQSKPDTSRNDDNEHYQDWFLVKLPGQRSEMTIGRAWYYLTSAERDQIAALAPRVTNNDAEEMVLADEDGKVHNGIGAYDRHLKDSRGNVLLALVEEWLLSGALFNDEDEFLKVLKLAGFKHYVRMFSPSSTMPFVYKVYLCIRNPLVSTTIPKNVIDALMAAGAKQRAKPFNYADDQWNKKTTDAKVWLRSLLDDIESTGGVNSWTVIPDWVTQTLKRLGYDGIKDLGGKMLSTQSHVVWIPFEENQVKSAITNRGYDPSKPNIHEDEI